MFDVVVIGGSYAGMAASLQLARARRRVLVIDAGEPRNRFAAHSHGFLTQDGRPPAELAADARGQLLAYPTVEWRSGRVDAVDGVADEFSVALDNGQTVDTRRLVLAAGVRDTLPDLPGLAEQWGVNVFHCPYCHGYELGQHDIGVLATSEIAMHQALMLPDWGETTLFINDAFEPDAAQSDQLAARGVRCERGAVAGVAARDDDLPGLTLTMHDGRGFGLSGLFVAPRLRLPGLVGALGVALEDTPAGAVIRTDAMQNTSVPGIYAGGDISRAAGSVTFAVAEGAMAGLSVHRSLMFGL